MSTRPSLTLLYSPADRPDRVVKALNGPADEVIVDLEDAVAPSAKDTAREHMRETLTSVGPDHTVQVRINAYGSIWFENDLEAVASVPQHIAIRIPKAEDPSVINQIANALPGRDLHLLIESALGVERAFELANCTPSVVGISLGEADLKSELSVDDAAGLTWIRSRIVVAARAAGLTAPVMSAFTNIRDMDGLRESCLQGKSLGFLGRTAIHPAQLEVIREAFLPTEQEIQQARETLTSLSEAFDAGAGAIALPNGRFLDAAMIQRARTISALAEIQMPSHQ